MFTARYGLNVYNCLNTTLCSPVVTICTASLTFSSSTFCPHRVFMCSVWISEQTAIISLYNINWLVFIIQTQCVYCAVRTGCSNVIQINRSVEFARSVHASEKFCDQLIRQSLPWFYLVLEQMLSWYPKSTLHCMLLMQPSSKSLQNFPQTKPPQRDNNFFNAALQTLSSFPLLHIRTTHF